MRCAMHLFLATAGAACSTTGDCGPVTGLILDASGARGSPPAAWRIVDEAGVEICSSEDLSERNGWKGVYWQRNYAVARTGEARKWVGKNPAEIQVKSVEWSKDRRLATFVLDAAAAEELYSLPAFRDFVRRADLEIVLGGL